MMHSLELRNLYKKGKDDYILNNINLLIYPNEIFGIIGPQKSGKAELLKVIAGLSDYDLGHVFFNNKCR